MTADQTPTAPVGRLASVSLDTTDPAALADFYGALLGMRRVYERPDGSIIAVSDGSIAITAMLAADHVRPTWPEPGQQQQLHLDVAVTDLPAAVATALRLGATEAGHQALDPAGHPFCLTTATGSLAE
jgi:catechol 2,3-dioxygenase-like lactoylglutathione lyase family enzyme